VSHDRLPIFSPSSVELAVSAELKNEKMTCGITVPAVCPAVNLVGKSRHFLT